MRKVEFLSNFSAQELTELLQTFSGSNLQGNYENNTCLSLQTSIDENDENLTTVHHRYLRKYYSRGSSPNAHDGSTRKRSC